MDVVSDVLSCKFVSGPVLLFSVYIFLLVYTPYLIQLDGSQAVVLLHLEYVDCIFYWRPFLIIYMLI